MPDEQDDIQIFKFDFSTRRYHHNQALITRALREEGLGHYIRELGTPRRVEDLLFGGSCPDVLLINSISDGAYKVADSALVIPDLVERDTPGILIFGYKPRMPEDTYGHGDRVRLFRSRSGNGYLTAGEAPGPAGMIKDLIE